MQLRIHEPERRTLAGFIIGFASLIVTWTILHDIVLIHIEPRHFTEFHRPLLPFTHPVLLAIQYAIVATLGPAMLFGALAWAAFRRRAILLPSALALFAPVLLLIELLAHVIARASVARWQAGLPLLYPKAWYPELTPGVIYTQSVNISSYFSATFLGISWLLLIQLWPHPFPDRANKSPCDCH